MPAIVPSLSEGEEDDGEESVGRDGAEGKDGDRELRVELKWRVETWMRLEEMWPRVKMELVM